MWIAFSIKWRFLYEEQDGYYKVGNRMEDAEKKIVNAGKKILDA